MLLLLILLLFNSSVRTITQPFSNLPAQPTSQTEKKRDEAPKGKVEAPDSGSTKPAGEASPLKLKDTRAAAINLVLSIGKQSEIDDPLDRLAVAVTSAKILATEKPIASREVVNKAKDELLDIKKKERDSKRKSKLTEIERQIIVVLSKLDPDGADELVRLAIKSNDAGSGDEAPGNTNPRERADYLVSLATLLIDNGAPQGVEVLAKSFTETGTVSINFETSFNTAMHSALLREKMKSTMRSTFTDRVLSSPMDLLVLAICLVPFTPQDDKNLEVIDTILNCELNSLQGIEKAIEADPGQAEGFKGVGLGELLEYVESKLRKQYIKWMPGRLKELDQCLQKFQELGVFRSGQNTNWEKADTFDEKIRLIKLLPSPPNRERQFVNLAFDVADKRFSDKSYSADQMIDKVLKELSSQDSKDFISDVQVVSTIKDLAKEKRFQQVAVEANRIGRDDWRVQVLFGAATGLDEIDPDAAEVLYLKLIDALDNSKPGTAVLRTALGMAKRYFEKDPLFGRRLLNNAIRYANNTSFSATGVVSPYDRTIYGRIGKVVIALGFEPERIHDALRDFDFGSMARGHWQALYETSNTIDNKVFRSVFQLRMSEAILNER